MTVRFVGKIGATYPKRTPVVDLERLPRILAVVLLIQIDAGVVDEDVDLATRLLHMAREGANAVAVGYVEGRVEHASRCAIGRSQAEVIARARGREQLQRGHVVSVEAALTDGLADAAVLLG